MLVMLPYIHFIHYHWDHLFIPAVDSSSPEDQPVLWLMRGQLRDIWLLGSKRVFIFRVSVTSSSSSSSSADSTAVYIRPPSATTHFINHYSHNKTNVSVLFCGSLDGSDLKTDISTETLMIQTRHSEKAFLWLVLCWDQASLCSQLTLFPLFVYWCCKKCP